MKKRLVSLGAVLVLAFVCCFGGVAFAQQDIEFMTDWRIYPGGSSVYSNDMTGRTCNKDIAGVPAVHQRMGCRRRIPFFSERTFL